MSYPLQNVVTRSVSEHTTCALLIQLHNEHLPLFVLFVHQTNIYLGALSFYRIRNTDCLLAKRSWLGSCSVRESKISCEIGGGFGECLCL